MSAVGAGVLAKLQAKLPNQIGANRQWETSYVNTLILAAAHAAEERIGMTWVSSTVSLADNTVEYALPSKFVEVVSVEFALDGTTYARELEACTLDDLDCISSKWRDDTGTEPTRYCLLSTPGTQDVAGTGVYGSKIIIHRGMAVAAPSTIRVSGWGIGTAATNVPDGVQERVHVPYVMAVLRAETDVDEAMWHYNNFREACDELKSHFVTQYAQQPSRMGEC